MHYLGKCLAHTFSTILHKILHIILLVDKYNGVECMHKSMTTLLSQSTYMTKIVYELL